MYRSQRSRDEQNALHSHRRASSGLHQLGQHLFKQRLAPVQQNLKYVCLAFHTSVCFLHALELVP